jgi:adhesin transport system outer membrane protein
MVYLRKLGFYLGLSLTSALSHSTRTTLKNICKNTLGCLLLTFIPPALSEDIAASLSELLAKAVQEHPSVLQRVNESEAAELDRDAAKWQRYPTVSVSAAEASSKDVDQVSTSVQQPLWTGGRISAAISEAEAGVRVAGHSVTQAELDILVETTARFFDLVRADRNVAIADANVQEHQRLFEIIERRVDAATSPDVDEMLALARLQYAESDAAVFAGAQDSAKGVLAQLVGEWVTSVAAPEVPEVVMMTREGLLELILDYSPSLAALDSERDRVAAQLDAAKAQVRPQLALAYDRRFGDILPGQEQEKIFLQVEYTPGAGLSARSSIAAARARQKSADFAVEAQKRAVISQFDILWSELQASYRQLGPARRLVEATTEVVDSYLRQYTVGRKSWLDVLNAQREATQARHTLVGTETSLMSAHYRMQILLGRINAVSLGAK